MTEAAPHKLLIEEREGYLYVVYGGDPLTLDMIVRTINAVADRIRSAKYDRVLLVRDAPLLESDENRAMVASMIRNLLGDGVRFAIVDVYGNPPDEVERAVAASRAAGWDLTSFRTEDAAIEWLTRN